MEALRAIGCAAADALEELSGFPTASEAVLEVAGTSNRWPLSIEAIRELHREKAEELATRIGLGSKLPIRVDPGTGRGSTRTFDAGSGGALATDVVSQLEVWRKPFEEASPATALQMQTEARLLLKILESETAIGAEKEALEEAKSDANRAADIKRFYESRRELRWQLKARCLPPLTHDQSTVAQWTEVGLLMLESECSGNWWTFPWAEEVFKRAEEKSRTGEKNDRLPRSVLKELLSRGLKAIARREK